MFAGGPFGGVYFGEGQGPLTSGVSGLSRGYDFPASFAEGRTIAAVASEGGTVPASVSEGHTERSGA